MKRAINMRSKQYLKKKHSEAATTSFFWNGEPQGDQRTATVCPLCSGSLLPSLGRVPKRLSTTIETWLTYRVWRPATVTPALRGSMSQFRKKQRQRVVQWLPGTPRAEAKGSQHSLHTQLVSFCVKVQSSLVRKSTTVQEHTSSCSLYQPAWHSESTRLQQLTQQQALATLAGSASSAERPRRGEGSKIKLTRNKLNQSWAITKRTRNISTVSHPTGWPSAQNFHYNFSKERRKGGKNIS